MKGELAFRIALIYCYKKESNATCKKDLVSATILTRRFAGFHQHFSKRG